MLMIFHWIVKHKTCHCLLCCCYQSSDDDKIIASKVLNKYLAFMGRGLVLTVLEKVGSSKGF